MQPNGPDLDDRWVQLLDGRLADAARDELLAVAAAELNQAVAARGGDCRSLLDALASVIDQPVSERLWADASRALDLALGGNPARLVGWLVVDSDYAERLAQLRPALDRASAAFLTDLLVRCGERLARASHLAVTRNEHDWWLVDRELRVDPSTGLATVRLKISKYNGEVVLIEGRPDSILTLAEAVLAAVNAVGDAAAFERELDSFMDTVGRTLAMFSVNGGQVYEAPNGAAEPAPTAGTEPVAVERAEGPPAPTPYR